MDPMVTKFFPAAQYGGLNTIKAICAPFTRHRFMPTGGVSLANVEEYLSCDKIIACGGTWMVKASMFADGDFSQVQQAAEAMNMVKKDPRLNNPGVVRRASALAAVLFTI